MPNFLQFSEFLYDKLLTIIKRRIILFAMPVHLLYFTPKGVAGALKR